MSMGKVASSFKKDEKSSITSFSSKLFILYCGFFDPQSLLHRVPKDIFRYLIVTAWNLRQWDEDRSHNVCINSEECQKPSGLESFTWNSFCVSSEPNPTFSSIQLLNPMDSTEYKSSCIMIGLAEEKHILKDKLNLYSEGGYYEMFWQFKVWKNLHILSYFFIIIWCFSSELCIFFIIHSILSFKIVHDRNLICLERPHSFSFLYSSLFIFFICSRIIRFGPKCQGEEFHIWHILIFSSIYLFQYSRADRGYKTIISTLIIFICQFIFTFSTLLIIFLNIL